MPAVTPMPRTPWKAMTHEMRMRAVRALSANGRPLSYVAERLFTTEAEISAFVEKHKPLQVHADDSGAADTVGAAHDSEPIAPDRKPVHLLDIGSEQCRFPLWPAKPKPAVSEMMMCGAPTGSPKQVYCPACHRRSFSATTIRLKVPKDANVIYRGTV